MDDVRSSRGSKKKLVFYFIVYHFTAHATRNWLQTDVFSEQQKIHAELAVKMWQSSHKHVDKTSIAFGAMQPSVYSNIRCSFLFICICTTERTDFLEEKNCTKPTVHRMNAYHAPNRIMCLT
jgi:hypothetical protein